MLTLLLILLVAALLFGVIGGPRYYRGRSGGTTIVRERPTTRVVEREYDV